MLVIFGASITNLNRFCQIKEPIELALRKDLHQEDTHLSIPQMPKTTDLLSSVLTHKSKGALKV